jgi:hypothetical protein
MTQDRALLRLTQHAKGQTAVNWKAKTKDYKYQETVNTKLNKKWQ